MKNLFSVVLAGVVCGARAFAQAPAPGGALDYGMEKLFSGNPVFSATMQTETATANGPLIVVAKMFYNHQNTRIDMDVANIKSAALPRGTVSQMQAVGIDKFVTIIPADKKTTTIVYPKLRSYATMALANGTSGNDYTIQSIKPMGSETVNGHPSTRNQVTMTAGNTSREFTVWNASDLNNFPVKISMSTGNGSEVLTFQNVSFNKLRSDIFTPPSNFTRYDTVQDIMQSAVMSHSPGAGSQAPAQH